MEFNETEDKENLPPYLKSAFLAVGSKNKRKQLTAAEKARVLKEKILEKREIWLGKSKKIKEMLTTPEEISARKKEFRNPNPLPSIQSRRYEENP
ncbi:hypothetical protein SteCoe_3473 [Stentor coeruleus]|uniref:Uncharacterized protein n=1 Tax=Stentor coeruleus TaxID=5963 RepID=A0A1R2CX09_9CILI|nr:hypothetical protein SteCoe_3473 [Stentor coeruleus]